MLMDEQGLREQICLIGQLMHRNQYIDGAGGNISARLDDGHILTTPSGVAKGFMTPDQMMVVDSEGQRVGTANEQLRPTSELLMHLECYRQRPDIGGVVHAHPASAIALSIAGYDLHTCLIPEVIVLLGVIPTLPYATPSSDENIMLIGRLIHQHDAMMLSYHGSLTVAKTVWDAYLRLENLEHNARIISSVQQLGGAKTRLEHSHIEKLLAIRERLGLLKSGDRETIYGFADSTRGMNKQFTS
jgi:L-fuculose-phosphate aldolase